MLICPITCSGIIKLVFVRGCNYQLPWHIPSLVVCTLPQYQASNRRKHSLTTLKWARRWPRTESLYVAHFGQRTASHSSLYRVRGEKASLNTTVSKPQLCEQPSTETQRGGRKYLQKETWQHREVGQPNGGEPNPSTHASQGQMSVSLGMLRAGSQQRAQQGSIHRGHLSYADSTESLFPQCHNRSVPTSPPQEWRKSSFSDSQNSSLHLLQDYCNSCAHQLVH